MNTRITQIRKSLNLNQKQFAEKLFMSQAIICEIESGKANITERLISIICLSFNVNENWLRTGEGEMFNIIDKKYDEFFSIYNNLSEPLQDFLKRVANDLLDTQKLL